MRKSLHPPAQTSGFTSERPKRSRGTQAPVGEVAQPPTASTSRLAKAMQNAQERATTLTVEQNAHNRYGGE